MKIAVALLLILALATAEQLLQNIYVNSDLTCTGNPFFSVAYDPNKNCEDNDNNGTESYLYLGLNTVLYTHYKGENCTGAIESQKNYSLGGCYYEDFLIFSFTLSAAPSVGVGLVQFGVLAVSALLLLL